MILKKFLFPLITVNDLIKKSNIEGESWVGYRKCNTAHLVERKINNLRVLSDILKWQNV